MVVGAVVVVLVGLGLGLGYGLGGASNPAAAARSAFRQALAAGRHSAGFRYVVFSQGGGNSQTTVGQAGTDDGTQHIGLNGDTFQLVLAPGGVVYFNGDAGSVSSQLGLSESEAAAVAGTWIAVHKGDQPYASLEAGITVSSALTQVTLTPRTVDSVRTATGSTVSRITGTLPGSGSGQSTVQLDVDPHSHLPLSYDARTSSDGQTGVVTMTFTHWGTAVTVSVPPGATTYASLPGANTGGGNGGGSGGGTPSTVVA